MKKGLGVTLFAVTWALVQTPAFAIAPIIDEIGDIIVGDLESATGTIAATGTNFYIFPDAVNVRDLISNGDDLTTDVEQLKWTFIDGLFDLGAIEIYRINGVASLTSSEAFDGLGAATPPAGKTYADLGDTQVATDKGNSTSGQPLNEDDDDYTITFRNVFLSPPDGPNRNPRPDADSDEVEIMVSEPNPNPGGLPGNQTRTLTLFASTCTTFGSQTVIVFTVNNGEDDISAGIIDTAVPEGPAGQGCWDFRIAAHSSTWIDGVTMGSLGSTFQSTTSGVCMQVDAIGNNQALWISPNNHVDLVNGSAFRWRMKLTTDQTAVDAIPLMTIVYDNFQGGFSNFGGERWLWDGSGAGGAAGIGRAVGLSSRSDNWEVWFAPIAVTAPQWTTANARGSTAFDPAADALNDLRLQFRVLDVNAGLNSELDSGTICVEQMCLSTAPMADLLNSAVSAYNPALNDGVAAVVANPTHSNPATENTTDPNRTHFVRSNAFGNNFPTVNSDIVAGVWEVEFPGIDATSDPTGLGLLRASLGPDTVSEAVTNVRFNPITWETGTLYISRARIRSDSGGLSANPPDVFIMNRETATAELGGLDFITPGDDLNGGGAGDGGGMLGAGQGQETAADFYSLFFGNVTTVSPAISPNQWKSKLDYFNRSDLGGSATSGQDGVAVEALEVLRVEGAVFIPLIP